MSPEGARSTPPYADSDVDDCPFCAIGRAEDHSVDVVCEERGWIAFLPLEPATPGHTLVIPRAHFQDLWSTPPPVGAELAAAVIRVGRAVADALQPEGMNLISSSGRVAEQTIFHLHLHLVPRWASDGFGDLWPPKASTQKALDSSVAARIRAACAAT